MTFRRIRTSILLTSAFSVLYASPLQAADLAFDWPQWRGPTRDGQVEGPKWPTSLSQDQLEVNWSVSLGPSYSGPIIASDRVFVTETQNRQNEVVRALDRETGQEIWKAEWPGAMSVPFFAKTLTYCSLVKYVMKKLQILQ